MFPVRKRRYWKREKEGKTVTVESYSYDLPIEGATEISKEEFDAFISSLPQPVEIDWKAKWIAARTQAERISILAEKLELK